MFSTKEQLDKRTGEFGVGREEFLTQIVNEFKETNSRENQKQVLANLANFAYDPINYEYLRRLRVLDLFLDQLSADDEDFQEFSIAGICNLCADRENLQYVLHQRGAEQVTALLHSSRTETLLNALATLTYLVNPQSKSDILTTAVLQQVANLALNPNVRISNLAKVFLSDYAT